MEFPDVHVSSYGTDVKRGKGKGEDRVPGKGGVVWLSLGNLTCI